MCLPNLFIYPFPVDYFFRFSAVKRFGLDSNTVFRSGIESAYGGTPFMNLDAFKIIDQARQEAEKIIQLTESASQKDAQDILSDLREKTEDTEAEIKQESHIISILTSSSSSSSCFLGLYFRIDSFSLETGTSYFP